LSKSLELIDARRMVVFESNVETQNPDLLKICLESDSESERLDFCRACSGVEPWGMRYGPMTCDITFLCHVSVVAVHYEGRGLQRRCKLLVR
jgi:hypothetical protein